jgi:hypothetical protein
VCNNIWITKDKKFLGTRVSLTIDSYSSQNFLPFLKPEVLPSCFQQLTIKPLSHLTWVHIFTQFSRSSYISPIMLLFVCFTETESVKPLVQSVSTDSVSKLYQVEIIGPIDKSRESESVMDRIKDQVEKNTRGTQEELRGDMLVSIT